MTVQDLPTLNATLNSAATVLLVSGYVCIRLKLVRVHIAFMVLALLVSTAFLAGYLYHHYRVGHVPFMGKGYIRYFYYPMLISHIALAATILPLVTLTVVPALRRKFDRHKRIARWTLPIWLYVSVTGVLVYLMCYIWYT
jgi:putative membrane protein